MRTSTNAPTNTARKQSLSSGPKRRDTYRYLYKLPSLYFAAFVSFMTLSSQYLFPSAGLAQEQLTFPSHIYLVKDLGIYVPDNEAFLPHVTLCWPPTSPPLSFDPCKICDCCIEPPTQLTAHQFTDKFFSTETDILGNEDLSVHEFGIAVKNEFKIPGTQWNAELTQIWKGGLDSAALFDNWVGKKPVYDLKTHKLFERLGKNCK